MRHAVVATCLALVSSAASAQLPCPVAQPDCSRAFARLVTSVELSFPRAGETGFTHVIGGTYGDVTPVVEDNGATRYQTELRVRSSDSLLAEAHAATLDGQVVANARAAVDLSAGQVRAAIDGRQAELPPQSFFESSGAEAVAVLQDTVYFQLPAGFAGGDATFLWTVDGRIGAARGSAAGPTFAEASVSAGGPATLRRWVSPGAFAEVLSASTALPALPGLTLPITFTSQLRLDSGAGGGAYDVDLYNTATLSIVVPDGVTWRSASGLLLTAVPEPGALLLLAAGLALVAARTRAGAPAAAGPHRG